MSAVPAVKQLSIEKYLLQEETSKEKHEYYQGEVFVTSGGTIDHKSTREVKIQKEKVKTEVAASSIQAFSF